MMTVDEALMKADDANYSSEAEITQKATLLLRKFLISAITPVAIKNASRYLVTSGRSAWATLL